MRTVLFSRRSALLAAVASVALVALAAPSQAQLGMSTVYDPTVNSTLSAGFSSLTSAVSGGFAALAAALLSFSSDTDAHFEQLLEATEQTQEALLNIDTDQYNQRIYNDELVKRDVAANACQSVAPAANLPLAEVPMRQQALTMATAQANLSRGASGTATANGPSASVADKVKAHNAVLANTPQLPNTMALPSVVSNAPATLGPVTDIDADALFADTAVKSPGTLTIDNSGRTQTLGELFIAHAFDPVPPPPQRNTNEPNEIKEARNSRASRMSLAMAVPIDVLSMQALTLDGSMRQIMPLPPPGSDNMSWTQMIDSMVKGRFENLDWYSQVQSMSSDQKQSEALYMQALQLYIDWRRFRFEQKVGVVMANLYAGQVDAMRGSSPGDITPTLTPTGQMR